jgi:hypothetical protein
MMSFQVICGIGVIGHAKWTEEDESRIDHLMGDLLSASINGGY